MSFFFLLSFFFNFLNIFIINHNIFISICSHIFTLNEVDCHFRKFLKEYEIHQMKIQGSKQEPP